MQIEADPLDSLIDCPTTLRVRGCANAQRVTIRAIAGDTYWRWASCGTFVADANGVVDIGNQAPISGTYSGIDPMGLFWSMDLNPATLQMSMRGEAIGT